MLVGAEWFREADWSQDERGVVPAWSWDGKEGNKSVGKSLELSE